MYDWRSLTSEERRDVLVSRKQAGRPWHSPPHWSTAEPTWYHLTAACYRHARIIGRTPERLASFAGELLDTLALESVPVAAWCLLPNHYHLLASVADLKATTLSLGRLHGRSARFWNVEDTADGRKVFHRAADRHIRSDRHFWATLNYIHHNPVHHGYVERRTNWPWSSAEHFVQATGAEESQRIWEAYPVLDYGAGWDDPKL